MEEGEAQPTVDSGLFEALFVRALDPRRAFLRELRQAGFNPARLELRYPLELWPRCLEIARRHVHPTLPHEEAMRALGTEFIKGYYATRIGRVNVAAMPLLGLERTLERVPRVLQLYVPSLEVALEQLEPGRWRLELREAILDPDFCAGMIEAGAEPFEVPFTVEVLERTPESAVLELRY